jgi:hypothetical protein
VSAPSAQCPRCHAQLAPGQNWCTTCGYAATTRILPPGNWRVPIIVVTVIFLLGLGGVAAAFVAVSGDTSEVVTVTNPPQTLPPTGTAPATTSSTPTTTTATTPTTTTATTTAPTTSTPTTTTPPPATSNPAGPTPTTKTSGSK